MKMASKYVITADQKAEIEQARKANKDKRIEAKLKVLVMRADGIGAKEISEATEFHPGRLYFAVGSTDLCTFRRFPLLTSSFVVDPLHKSDFLSP